MDTLRSLEQKNWFILTKLFVEIFLLYIFASLAIDTASYWYYLFAVLMLAGAIRNIGLLIKKYVKKD